MSAVKSEARGFIHVSARGPSVHDVARLVVDRDPCACGTRKDMHDQYGCKAYRRAG